MAGLASKLEEIAERVTSPTATSAAADAMASAMRDAIGARIGGDLRMSRFSGGPARVEPTGTDGRAELEVGGATYALADGGRRTSRPARARRGSGLATPWGPRANVKGSTSAGFGIGAAAGPDVIQAGVDALRARLDVG